jgi:primosomal protein N' (replication factor Y)
MRVVVPFGRKVVTGFLTEVAVEPDLPPSQIKEIQELLDPEPVLSDELLEFTRWVGDHYIASWGEVMKAALPAGIHVRSVPGYHLTPEGERVLSAGGLNPVEHALLRRVDRSAGLAKNLLGRGEDGKNAIRAADLLVRRRLLAAGPVRQEPRVRDRTERWLVLAPGAGQDERKRAAGRSRIAAEVLGELEAAGGALRLTAITSRHKSPHVQVKKLIAAKVIESQERPVEPSRTIPFAPRQRRPRLNPAQRRAVAALEDGFERGGFRVALLRGITGSGKTEVYLRGLEAAAERGRRGLYLVPEISLTPLLERTIRSRFPGAVEVLHSGLRDRDRLAAWRRIREGRARVVLGTRSAVFAPQPDLGLIVVDEEQEESYKQEETPRYHGRDAAVVRAKMAAAQIVLGTATPSLETYHHAATGRYDLLEMPERVQKRSLPAVSVIDMRDEFRRRGERVILSLALEEALRERRQRGEQSLVLLNRRGWAAFLLCRSCGKVVQCARCSISFTYHRAEGVLKCHYCARRQPMVSRCPSCDSEHLHLGAEGTEQVERVIRVALPGVRLARMDRDTVARPGRSAEILERFEAGDDELLLGTQMIAKGHHFPRVTLVGVLFADHLLAFPDFRASERTFQLLTQVAGRSGRGEIPGEVVIQAFHTEHYAIEAARLHDPAMFYDRELHYRRLMKYPPFSVMAALIVRNRDAARAERDAACIGRLLEEAGQGKILILGPALAPIGRLRGEFRHQILVKGAKRGRIRAVLNEVLGRLRDVRIHPRNLVIDVDPLSAM